MKMWFSSALVTASVGVFLLLSFCSTLLTRVLPAIASFHKVRSTSPRENKCICPTLPRPDLSEKAKTARWMVKSINWCTLSTISSRLEQRPDGELATFDKGSHNEGNSPVPFGNVYSFVDGPCDSSTGIPYIYGTYMDQSFIDTKENLAVSLTLSEAALDMECFADEFPERACSVRPLGFGDAENPLCARLVLSGTLEIVTDKDEFEFGKQALLSRHPSMRYWPSDHSWLVAKIDIKDIWLIDVFGGASLIDVDDYKAVTFNDDN